MKLTLPVLSVFLPVLLFFLFTLTTSSVKAEYPRCKTGSICTIGEFLFDDNYAPIPPTNASCTLAIKNPNGMDLPGSPFAMMGNTDGWYAYNFNSAGHSDGVYRTIITCTVSSPSETLRLDKTFVIGPSFESATDIANAVWSATNRSLTTFGTLVQDIWNAAVRSLTTRQITPEEHIAREETIQRQWTTRFSGDGEVLTGKTYRAKLWVLNYRTELTDAVTIPTYTIYDAMRNQVISNAAMIRLSTGVYEIVYHVSGGATGGRWETVVNINVGGAAPIQDGSYWEVEASPAQVTINAITDNTVPSITANIIIMNEGASGYEYRYVYCVVSSENNACGGGDDTFYNSGSKFLKVGEAWITNFNATVNNPGKYWFKVVVQWGSEFSGASQTFTAVRVACLGDYNSDGWVDLTDFSIMLFYWNQHSPTHDLSGDGWINLTDFSIMLFHWGRCP